MGTEKNKALVRRLYEILDEGDPDALDQIMAEDYEDHSPPPFPGLGHGREGVKEAFRIFWEATPGRHVIEDQIAEGDKVVTRLTAYGRHEADLPGIPRTGNELRMTATAIHRIENGLLAEKWSDKDVLGFLQQLEVLPRLGPPQPLEPQQTLGPHADVLAGDGT
jgi:predicted ester cyclase